MPAAAAKDVAVSSSSGSDSSDSDDDDDDDEQPASPQEVEEAKEVHQFAEVPSRKAKAKATAAKAKAKAKAAAAAIKLHKAELQLSAQNLSGAEGKYKKLKEQFRKWRHTHGNEPLAAEYSATPGMTQKVNGARNAIYMGTTARTTHACTPSEPSPPHRKQALGINFLSNEHGSLGILRRPML